MKSDNKTGTHREMVTQVLKKSIFHLLLVLIVFLSGSSAWSQNNASIDDQIATVQSRMDEAVTRVKTIVNQPVTRLRRSADMRVGVFTPGWFHEGAVKPDFATVDVRATQEFPYSKYTYVTSDLNPGEAFIASELEFNSMTKYFYTDRMVPKRRLSDAEMLEINQLYWTIAQCTEQLDQLKEHNGFFLTHMSGPSLAAIALVITLAVGGFFLKTSLARN